MPDNQRSRPLSRLALALGVLLMSAGPTTAQNAEDDWDLTREDGKTIAMIVFNEGVGIAVRCQRRTLDFTIIGLPEAATGAQGRRLQIAFGDEPLRETGWFVGEPRSAVVTESPEYYARTLRQGGLLQIVAPPEAGRSGSRYRLPLPRSTASVDTVLSACDRPLEDPDDLLARASPAFPTVWVRRPAPVFPAAAQSRGRTEGAVRVSCEMVGDGRLTACRVEHEDPEGVDFGAQALRSVHNARVAMQPQDAGMRISFTIRFRLG